MGISPDNRHEKFERPSYLHIVGVAVAIALTAAAIANAGFQIFPAPGHKVAKLSAKGPGFRPALEIAEDEAR